MGLSVLLHLPVQCDLAGKSCLVLCDARTFQFLPAPSSSLKMSGFPSLPSGALDCAVGRVAAGLSLPVLLSVPVEKNCVLWTSLWFVVTS